MCWFLGDFHMRYAQRLVSAAAVYIYMAFRSVAVDSCLFSFLLVRSRSVVPGVLEANECLAVVVGSEHQLFVVLAAYFWSRTAFLRGTYEEPHGCAETAGSDSVERPDRRDADGVAAVCVREWVCAGHCGVVLLCGSQKDLSMARCIRVLYAVWVSRAGGL